MPFDGSELSQTTAVLIKARDYMIEHGWCQRSFDNAQGNVCIVGAINKVTNPNERYTLRKAAISKIEIATKSRTITGWNDDRRRTFKTVIAAFNKAIANEIRSR